MNDRFRMTRGGMNDRVDSGGASIWMERLLAQLAYLRQLTAEKPMDIRYGLLSDVVHMQLNRTFISESREQELLVYYWLEKRDAICYSAEKGRDPVAGQQGSLRAC